MNIHIEHKLLTDLKAKPVGRSRPSSGYNLPALYRSVLPVIYKSTDPFVEVETIRTRAKMMRAMLIAALFLAIFNSTSLVQYVRGLPTGKVEDTVIALAETWHEHMNKNRLTELIVVIRGKVLAFKESSWSDLAIAVGLSDNSVAAPDDLRDRYRETQDLIRGRIGVNTPLYGVEQGDGETG